MIRALAFAALSSVLASCGGTSSGCVTPDAQGVVAANRPDEQFRSMLLLAVNNTQTGAMVAQRDGPDALSEAVDTVVERHSEEWERNLVASWGELGQTEIGQACEALASRDEATYMVLATRVGGKVQQLNEPLLRRAAVEVLELAY